MSRVVNRHTVDRLGLDELLTPRQDLVVERPVGDGVFEAAEGPVREYRRSMTVVPRPDGQFDVVETTEFRLALVHWWPLLVKPFGMALRRRHPAGAQPWWAPPQRLDARATEVLGALLTAALVAGYLGTLITQTITFAAEEFDVSDLGQGQALAAVRISVLLALVLVAAADRRGRRPLLLLTATAGCVVAATGALAPSMEWLAASQTFARGFSIALAVLIAIVAAEEMPAGSRAYAISVIALTGALGAGMCLWVLPVADLDERAWRIVYLVPLLGLLPVAGVRRVLPETRRFAVGPPAAPMSARGGRLWLLAVAAFLVQAFGAPVSQFLNEFLRDERDFSAAQISIFVMVTTTPAAVSVLLAGRLADLRGRRPVAAVALVGRSVFAVAMFAATGWWMWLWSFANQFVGNGTVPTFGAYLPELFPTSLRGRANGLVTLVGVAGSATGLLVVGALSDAFDGLAPAMSVAALGPLVVAFLVLTRFPETARVELEELNPEDVR